MNGKKEKLLLIHKHFYPDTPPYAVILKEIAQCLDGEGYKVTILSTHPSYKGNKKSAKSYEQFGDSGIIIRFKLILFLNKKISDLVNFVYFPFRIFLYLLLNPKFDVVTISTAPPVLGGAFISLAAILTNTKLIYHCMDIHPEIGKLSGDFSNRFVFAFLQKLDRFTCKVASKIIVLSKDMKEVIIQSRVSNAHSKVAILNNFSLPIENEKKVVGIIDKYLKKPDKVRLLFAGNLGRFQGLEELVKAFSCVENTNMELVFFGEGKALNKLKDLSSDYHPGTVIFYPHLPINDIKIIMKDADFGIVSLQSEIINYAYPSKTMTYLEQELPIISIVESESELSKFVNDNNIGCTISSGDVDGIMQLLIAINNGEINSIELKKNIYNCYKENFIKEKILTKWKMLIMDVIND